MLVRKGSGPGVAIFALCNTISKCFSKSGSVTRGGIVWSLRACEQCVYFCEHEHLKKIFLASSEHFRKQKACGANEIC